MLTMMRGRGRVSDGRWKERNVQERMRKVY